MLAIREAREEYQPLPDQPLSDQPLPDQPLPVQPLPVQPLPDQPLPDQPLPEKVLARLWQKRAARQREFRTTAGRRVRVLYAGRPGVSAGPDFRDALVEVEGLGLVQGDVELHLRQRDWYAHGHADDPNYNGVVLHAALETDPQPTNLHSGHQAPVVSLAGLLEDERDEESLPHSEEEGAGRGQEPGLWSLLEQLGWPRPADAGAVGQLLDAAGDARFRARASLFASLSREQAPSQTLYEGLMEALGYRANRQPFLKLAQRAPWAALASEAAAIPVGERAGLIEARLALISGLAGLAGLTEPAQQERPPARAAGYGRPLLAEEWHTFRVRPANHPRRRIAGAAVLLSRFLEGAEGSTAGPGDSLVAGLESLVAAGSPARLTGALAVKADGGGAPAPVGTDRARDLAVNVVLPFCHALAEGGSDNGAGHGAGEESGTAALALYRKFPKLQANEITREMAERLLAPEWAELVNNARRQQGLIHLHRQLAS